MATFAEYLTARGLSVDKDKAVLEVLAEDFFEDITFCTTPPVGILEKAKHIVAYASDGEFDNNEVSSGKVTTKEGLGRGALVDEFEIVDSSVLGADKVSKMKRLGVYDLLSQYLCSSNQSSGIFVV